MCLIITVFAFVIATVLYYKTNKFHNSTFEILPIIYLGTSLMWCVDGFFNLYDKEPFCEISLKDTALGLITIAFGIIITALVYGYKKILRRK